MEFADYRRYTPGDDFRRIDWRAYARLERLFLRIFEAEENIPVTILIDCSASMVHGEPEKATQAKAIAAALAYIALKCEDSVIMGALTDKLVNYRKIGGSKNAIWKVGDFLNQLPSSGTTNLSRALYDMGRVLTSPGLTIVISDFLDVNGYETGVRAIRQLRQEIALLQILSPDEIDPQLQGDWQLRDSEGKQTIEVSASSHIVQAYRERLARFTSELAACAHTYAGSYTLIASDTEIIDVVQRLLRQIELVK
jgi:uncharacterized protein (DUF58 family)